jgi:hypothetical protein
MEEKSIKSAAGCFIYRYKRKHYQISQDYKKEDLIKLSPEVKKQKYDLKREKENWEAPLKEKENKPNMLPQIKVVKEKSKHKPIDEVINEKDFETKVTIKNRNNILT